MSLLTPTANLMSNIMANSRQTVPAVGMGATALLYSDRHAGTIVDLITNKAGKVVGFYWQRDNATRTDKLGMTDSGQQYAFTPNTDAARVKVTLRKNGRWVQDGENLRTGRAYTIGTRDEFYDFTK